MVECEYRDRFCLLCACFAPDGHNCKITKHMQDAYETHFKVTLQTKWYIPEVMCVSCQATISRKPIEMKYVVPTIWQPRNEHTPDLCYFCVNFKRAVGFTYATRNQINYETVASVIPPVLRSDDNSLAPGKRDSGHEQMDVDAAQIAGPSAGPSAPPVESSAPVAAARASAISPNQPNLHEPPPLANPKKFTADQFESLARELELSYEQKDFLASRFIDMGALDSDYLSDEENL